MSDGGRERIRRLSEELLPALVARVEASDLGELELREDGWRIRLRKAPLLASHSLPGDRGAPLATDARQARERRGAAAGRRRGTAEAGAASRGDGRGPVAAVGPGREATAARGGRPFAVSPAVGYYVPKDGLMVGHPVRAGDLLGHVDVLGVRHDLVSPIDGVVARVLAEPGQAVEYGQELVRLDPLPRSLERPRGGARPAPA